MVAAGLAVSAGGCGLVDSSTTTYDVSPPDQTFTIDVDAQGFDNIGSVIGLQCNPPAGVCAVAAAEACPSGQCSSTCDGTGHCAIAASLELFARIDVAEGRPELMSINSQDKLVVTIDEISYQVTENTLNFATPSLNVAVAPSTVMTEKDPAATSIALIGPIAAGTIESETSIPTTSTGAISLENYLANFATPFNVIVGGDLEVSSSNTAPAGRLVTVVHVVAHAQ